VGAGSTVTLGCRTFLTPTGLPQFAIESRVRSATGYTYTGYVIDPDTASPIDVHIYVDNKHVSTVKAGASRPDVAAVYPAHGADHGFSTRLKASPGLHSVCVYGINVKAGQNVLFKQCRTVEVLGGSPDGRINSIAPTTGGATVTGWAIDYDTAAPIDVHIYVDGKMTASTTANVARTDLAAAFPKWGGTHGYTAFIPLAKGPHQICTYGINVGSGKNMQLACKSVTIR
jgi:hypothetical protein